MSNTANDTTGAQFGPWNPGLESRIPRDLRHLSTIFRPENVCTDVAKAEELRDFTGLEIGELVAFRPERLALHELLIRVTADFSVPDGTKIEDLGINFRADRPRPPGAARRAADGHDHGDLRRVAARSSRT